jgi:alanine-synthesizing transaminase
MFSNIATRLRGETNPLYAIRDRLISDGCEITDLISGNVNDHGILYPQELLQSILIESSRKCAVYHPDSFGQKAAREAISEYYEEQGLSLSADSILLTPGSSTSYWYCFKLLADEGDEILCPSPSYPLFEYIALLSGVRMIPYRLTETDGWGVDLAHLEACISTRTRALALISPHNPTGHVSSHDEISELAEIASRHNLAIISDEVFSEFLLDPQRVLPRPAGSDAPLVITINGLSKMYALPGVKLGWIAVSGEAGRVGRAMKALEMISDTFLPVNEIIQAAVPDIMKEGRDFLWSYAGQIRERWRHVDSLLSQCDECSYVRPDGGFYVTVRLQTLEEERAAETILGEDRILLHPGHFYDLKPNHLVLSFIQEPEVASEAYPRLLVRLARISHRVS